MSFDLTNKNIQDTFQNLLQKTGSDGRLYDLVGNQVRDLTIDGTLTANTYITSESITNTSSGSTAFGNDDNDSHSFKGDITASGDISASGILITDTIASSQLEIKNAANNETMFRATEDGATQLFFNNLNKLDTTSDGITVGGSILTTEGITISSDITANGNIVGDGSTNITNINDINASGDITASGNISSSATSTGSFGHILIKKDAFNEDNFVGIEITNVNGAGTTGDQSLITFKQDVVQPGGKIIAGREASYANVASRRSFLEFYTTQNGTDTKKVNIDGNAGNVTVYTGSLILKGSGSIDSQYGTGHITASGNISSSGELHGIAVGTRGEKDFQLRTNHTTRLTIGATDGTLNAFHDINTDSHITASGDISSSGTITAEHFHSSDDISLVDNGQILLGDGGDLSITHNSVKSIITNTTGELLFENDADNADIRFKGTDDTSTITALTLDMSEAGAATFNSNITAGGDLDVDSHITASGDISASGIIKASQVQVNGTSVIEDLVASDTQGRLTQTVSSLAQPIQLTDLGTTGNPTFNHITASGNISASGTMYGKQIHWMHHAYLEDSDDGENFIPMAGTLIEVSTAQYYNKKIAPYDGEILKVFVNFENDPGNTIVAFYKNGTKSATQTIVDASIGTDTTIFDNINTAPGFAGADRTFSQGDILSVSINPANAPGEVQVTTVWSYTVGP